MDPKHRQHLQRIWDKLLNSIVDVDSVIDGMYTHGIITPAMKNRIIVSMLL